MTPDVWREVSGCLDRLMDLGPADAEAYLRQLRADRPELAAEVESLWRQSTVATHFHAPPTASLADAPITSDRLTPAVAGGYELRGEIARGGMGAVYEAHDPTLGRTLAVKVLLLELRGHPEAHDRFVREAGVTGRLQHPGIPPIHELGRLADGSPYFAMKLIRGRTLGAMLADAKPDRGETVATFEQICRTLAYAHAEGVIHRDLKPGNVMVGAFGEVQVMDWGLAAELARGGRQPPGSESHPVAYASGSSNPHLTAAGDVRGTPAYMAPEQARGEAGELDERCDVFGLGGILAAMLTRQPTYSGPTADMLVQARLGEVGPALRRVEAEGIDADLLAVVRRCLAPLKEDRFRHAGEVADAVTAYRASARKRLEAAEVARQTAETQTREERRRRRAVIGWGTALLVAVSVGLGVAVWLWRLADEAEQRVKREQARTEETAAAARKAIKDSFILATEHPEFQKHGMQEARKLLLDRALAFYREFTHLRADDPALREEVADAHERIGRILAERGEARDALAANAEAVRLTERLLADRPGEVRLAAELADRLAARARREVALGQLDEAGESLAAARRHLDAARTADPDSPAWALLDAELRLEHGSWCYARGRLDETAAACQQVLDRTAGMTDRAKFNRGKVAWTEAGALVVFGHARKDQRRPADALALYRRAAGPLDERVAAEPGPHALAERARLHGSMAIVQDAGGRTGDAVESHRAAIRLREQLVALNPAVPDYRYDLALSHLNLADDLGPGEGSRKALERAAGLTAALAKEFPDRVNYLHQAAFVRFALARTVRQDVKEVARAEELLAEARAHLDELERRKAMSPLFRKTLAMWETEAGQVARIKEQYGEAVGHFAAAERVYGDLLREGFQVENCRFDVARQQMSFAYAAGKVGNYDQALRAQHAGVEQLTELLKVRPDDKDFRASLDKARANMVSIGNDGLLRDFPPPKEGTVENWVTCRRARLARWQDLFKRYPSIDDYRRQAADEAVRVAAVYGVLLDPARKVEGADRQFVLDKVDESLKQAREIGLRETNVIENQPGLAHYRKLPEYAEFVKTLK